MTERDLLRDLEFAVGRVLSDDFPADEMYEYLRSAYSRLTIFRMEKKYGQKNRDYRSRSSGE